MQEFIKINWEKYYDVINTQIFLQEQGVSFSYTDSITYFEREDIVKAYSNFIDMKNKKNQEALAHK